MRGDFEAARSLIRRGRDPLADAGLAVHYAATSQVAAFVEAVAGDREAALRAAREGFDGLSKLGEHAYASTSAVDIAWLLCDLGRDDESERWVRTARELSPAADAATLVSVDSVDAVLRVRRGENAEAERLARRAVEHAEGMDFWKHRGGTYEALALVLAAAGRPDEAEEALEAAIRIYDAKGSVVSAERATDLLAEL
jgi:tetratricopeptide (TPR) repeat protein